MNKIVRNFEPDTATPVDPLPEVADDPTGFSPQPNDKGRARKRGFLLLGAAVGLGLAAYGGYSLLAGDSEGTDDAYVAGDVVAITSREAGNVIALHADDTQSVRRGEPLIDLDPATADAQLAAAEAKLAQSVRSVRSAFARVDETSAEIVQANAELSRARNDLARRQQAAADGAVSGEEVSHAADSVRTAAATLALAQSRHAQASSTVQGTSIRTNPDVLEAIAAYRRAAIVKSHMHIIAPVDGVIAKRAVQLGQQVSPGAPLMAVVPLKRLWIDANFRETQLADLRVGQPVVITSDAYGSSITFHGKVEGLGAGSGNAFALLPPQNASGNWIKIVQRLPVRIALDPHELDHNPLRIGLSVTVKVDTRDHSGIPVARAATRNFQSQQSDDGGAGVEQRLAAIIAENAGGRGL
ncbi:efflux RND transporter periplasmic adaptor subunit [Sphingobium sp. EM0848]|uniref:efflux RND transporter periplasmic adaptor subunit n=1 Tax=Sphingobium sp. EM0848 TaxID=2743473 RepID=UPI00159C0EF7|nr:efflux RND transporter periplasmic adaptor subunit [Sphingobium sp. EM0848]